MKVLDYLSSVLFVCIVAVLLVVLAGLIVLFSPFLAPFLMNTEPYNKTEGEEECQEKQD